MRAKKKRISLSGHSTTASFLCETPKFAQQVQAMYTAIGRAGFAPGKAYLRESNTKLLN